MDTIPDTPVTTIRAMEIPIILDMAGRTIILDTGPTIIPDTGPTIIPDMEQIIIQVMVQTTTKVMVQTTTKVTVQTTTKVMELVTPKVTETIPVMEQTMLGISTKHSHSSSWIHLVWDRVEVDFNHQCLALGFHGPHSDLFHCRLDISLDSIHMDIITTCMEYIHYFVTAAIMVYIKITDMEINTMVTEEWDMEDSQSITCFYPCQYQSADITSLIRSLFIVDHHWVNEY